MIRRQEAEAAEIQIVHPEAVIFQIEWLQMHVIRDRFQAGMTQEPYEDLRDLVVGTFGLLRHTPLRVLGINRDFHYGLESEGACAAGHLLAPKQEWEEVLSKPGMVSLTMEKMSSSTRQIDKEGAPTLVGEELLCDPNRDFANQTQVEHLEDNRGDSHRSSTVDARPGQLLLFPPPLRAPQEHFNVLQKWEGYVIEVRRVFQILDRRKQRGVRFNPAKFASADKLLYRDQIWLASGTVETKVFALSPSDASILQAKLAFAELLPKEKETKKRVTSPAPNYASVVL